MYDIYWWWWWWWWWWIGFCGMVNWRRVFSLISSRDHSQRSLPFWISDTLQAEFEPAQSLSLGFVKWSCAAVITTTYTTVPQLSEEIIYNNFLRQLWCCGVVAITVAHLLEKLEVQVICEFFKEKPHCYKMEGIFTSNQVQNVSFCHLSFAFLKSAVRIFWNFSQC